MEDLFRDYWWLMFPLGWVAFAAFQGLLAERRRSVAMDLVRAYAEKGQAAPPELERVAFGKGGC